MHADEMNLWGLSLTEAAAGDLQPDEWEFFMTWIWSLVEMEKPEVILQRMVEEVEKDRGLLKGGRE